MHPFLSFFRLQIPPSVTIAELELEARKAAVEVSSGSRERACSGGDKAKEDLIVLRKDDLNSILTSKPAVLIGREIVRAIVDTHTNDIELMMVE